MAWKIRTRIAASAALLSLMLPAGAAPILTVEAEARAGMATANAGNIARQGMANFGKGWSGDTQLFWRGASTGAVLDIPFDVSEGAVYAVELYFTRAPDYGRVAIQIDGQTSPVTYDGYAPRVAPPTPTQGGKFRLPAGKHRLSLKIVGKAEQSSGYHVGLDMVRLYPAGELAEGTANRPGSPAVAQAVAPPAPPAAPSRRSEPPRTAPSQSKSGGGAPAAPLAPGADCDSTCLGNVSTVYRKTDAGQCKPWFRVACNPYGCEAASGMCRAGCVSDTDCSQGGACDTTTGLCAAMTSICLDALTVRNANGQTQSCIPYKCYGAGICRSSCSDTHDCSSGFNCNLASGHCVPSKSLKKP